MPSLKNKLTFDNRFVEQLPGDFEPLNYARQVHHAAYSFVTPTSVAKPQLVALSYDVAQLVGFDSDDLNDELFTDVFTGNSLLDGMTPFSMCYGGHQFGHWAGQLGDGRAINLGEVVTPNHGHQTLQLKGAGMTPYSRTADGLAVLRSSVREFLCSEAMFHLGVPTTRALSLCLTGTPVMRDMFYDGRGAYEAGAVVCRVSSSFMRFGNFQLPANRQDEPLLRQLIDHCITADYPHLGAPSESVYLQWFREIAQRTCDMIIHWQRVGFVHGVMNTDNMSIMGETIDYGPYGWVDDFDVNWTPNTTDAQGKRYRFGAQGEIGQWNLFQLANAIYPIVGQAESLEEILRDYADSYQLAWRQMMAAKLGLLSYQGDDDNVLFHELELLLMTVETDMTIFYRQLATLNKDGDASDCGWWLSRLSDCYYRIEQLDDDYKQQFSLWLARYLLRLNNDNRSDEQRTIAMNGVNPKYVLRNYLAQQAIEAADNGDFSEIATLQTLLQFPYDEQPEFADYAKKRPEWARHKAGCSTLSCSS
ncbi:MAG: YdiU family protein [Psychrobium sp.]|nr:YdiU family protein [Psychrobium sp.]